MPEIAVFALRNCEFHNLKGVSAVLKHLGDLEVVILEAKIVFLMLFLRWF